MVEVNYSSGRGPGHEHRARPGRGENKAGLEGTFPEWERQFGSISLDDSTQENLIQSATREAVQAFLAARNHATRVEYGGKSRLQVLREACPSLEQQKRDLGFIRNLKVRHENKYPTYQNEGSSGGISWARTPR